VGNTTGNVDVRIMVVDDDPCIINLLVAVVRNHFNIQEVLGITDSSKASETFNEFKPTVIVIDQSMPNFSGVELIKAIREFDSDVGILFTTDTHWLRLSLRPPNSERISF
jgi:two-component system, OmpR family, response regulator